MEFYIYLYITPLLYYNQVYTSIIAIKAPHFIRGYLCGVGIMFKIIFWPITQL